jgi:hypothetical protein
MNNSKKIKFCACHQKWFMLNFDLTPWGRNKDLKLKTELLHKYFKRSPLHFSFDFLLNFI